jgi:predicted permease
MSIITDLTERLRALFRRGRAERELDEELRDHLARDVAERVRRGADPAEARRAALASFGGIERVKDEVREARGIQTIEELAGDVRFALRSVRLNPGFAAAVIAVLGLGLGAATAAWRVYDAVLLAALPYPSAERLVQVFEKNRPDYQWNLSAADVLAIRDQNRSFEVFGAWQTRAVALAGAGEPERVSAGRVTSGFFQALSVRAVAGRLVEARDETPGAPAVVVLSHAMATKRFGGAREALGRTVTLDGVNHEVVGVLARGEEELAGVSASAWPALQLLAPTRRGPFPLRGIGRLRPGVSLEAAARDLAGVSARLLPLWPDFTDREAKLTPLPLQQTIVGDADGRIALFAGAVALALLIAVANVATLMLVRATARTHELAVRVALGATRARLARLMVAESLTLTVLAGAAGVVIGALALRLVGVVMPGLPRLSEVTFDGRTVWFTAAATVLSGLLVSVAPLSGLLAGRASASLRVDGGRSGTSRDTSALRGALVVAEFALALPLLLGAGLLLNSFLRLQRVDPGYDPAGVVAVSVSLPAARYNTAASLDFMRRAEARLREVPGVTAVGLSTAMPPDNPGDEDNFDLIDRPVPAGAAQPVSAWSYVTAGFFPALRVPLREGRLFGSGDSANGLPVIVVSRAWAARYYPGDRVLGRQLIQGGCITCPPTTIVGVVGDVKYQGLARSGVAVYGPIEQSGWQGVNLVVRGTRAPAELIRASHSALRGLDAELPLVGSTLEDRLRDSLADPRRWTQLIGGFAAAAALLAALGVFGLMSFVVRQRRREMGVRLALGADPAALTRLVVRRGMRYALLGTAIGLALAALEERWIGGLLFGVAARDPATVAAAVAALLVTALLACWIPGRRAARVRPIEVLGAE